MNDTTAAIISDLRLLVDQARWAHVHGYWKEGHGLDAERGTDLSKTEAERDKGPTYDLQIGSHPARVAYQHAVAAVAHADRMLAVLLLNEGQSIQPKLIRLDAYSPPIRLVDGASRAAWRAERITRKHAQLKDVREKLDTAVRGLSKALDHGTTDGIAHGEMCKTCGIRPRAEHTAVDGAVTVRRQGECETCARYRARTGQQRDAKKLDGEWLNQARAAQQRRIARGESWGVA